MVYKRGAIRFAASLRSKNVVLRLLSVDCTPEYSRVAVDVGAGKIRISPSIIGDVLSVSGLYGSGEGGRRSREST